MSRKLEDAPEYGQAGGGYKVISEAIDVQRVEDPGTAYAGEASEPIISWRAHVRGYHSLEELKAGVLKQRSVWWQGKSFHCALCDLDIVDATRAAEHVVMLQHPVLRMD